MRTRIARYELGRELGHGGSGTVYEARVVGTGGPPRMVALKILRDQQPARLDRLPSQTLSSTLVDPSAPPSASPRTSLLREARLGSLLRHPHIVDVYEVGEDDGVWFCAMELCRGGSLAAWRPLPPRAVVEVGLQVCAALDYAHRELGLVHLDLKPANLLLNHGVVKVADLGIARAEGVACEPGIRGTMGYMAPEQLAGGRVDARTDVYALGVTLVELARGESPHATETFGTASLMTGLAGGPVDAGPISGLVEPPPWLAPAVAPCLEVDPAGRWPSMASLADALRALEVGGPGLAELDPTGLPAPARRGALVGRAAELAAVEQALDRERWVTLKGPPGIGKSRLAEAVLDRWVARGRPGCRVATAELPSRAAADLDGERARAALLRLVATRLDLPFRPGTLPEQVASVGEALAARGSILLVLDDLERPGEHAPVVAAWAEAAPKARILVTSRERARAEAERVVEVGPLDAVSARTVLVDRARERGVEIAGEPRVDELAARLDRVPLALELAAGRLGVLALDEVIERLGLSLLRQGTDEERHGTLRAALDESWDALVGEEREALAALSTFAGSFGQDAAAEVLGGPADRLEALQDRSLLRADGPGRWSLLAPVRAFAAERLADREVVEARHGRWFAAHGEDEAIEALFVHGGRARLEALEGDHADLVSACGRAVERGDGPTAVATLRAVWTTLRLRGPAAEGVELAERVCAMPAISARAALGARALLILEEASSEITLTERAVSLLERAVELATIAGSAVLEIEATLRLGEVESDLGRRDRARVRYERCLELARAAPSGPTSGPARAFVRLSGLVRANLGILLRLEGRLDEAEACYARAHAELLAARDIRGLGRLRGNQATLAYMRGRLDEAVDLYTESIARFREAGDRLGECDQLSIVGSVLNQAGRPEQATVVLRSALALARELGDTQVQGSVAGTLGNIEVGRGRHVEARPYLEQALAAHRASGRIQRVGVAGGNLANVLVRLGEEDLARAHYREAIEVAERFGDRATLAIWLARLARCTEDSAGARALLERAEQALDEAAEVSLQAYGRVVVADMARCVGDRERAWKNLAMAESLAATHPLPSLTSKLAELRAALGSSEDR